MKCKDCSHLGYNSFFDSFHCEINNCKIIDESAELNCNSFEDCKSVYYFENTCMWCCYSRQVGFDRYTCDKLHIRIDNVVCEGTDCGCFRYKNDHVLGTV